MAKVRKNYRIKEEVSKALDALVKSEREIDPNANETVVVEKAIAFFYMAMERRKGKSLD